MRVTTLDSFAGRSIEDTLGVVRGTVMWTRGLKKFSRGGIRAVEYMTSSDVAEGLNQARMDAEAAMKRQAAQMGADGIIGLKFEMIEMGGGMFQASVTGTAVRTESSEKSAPVFGKRMDMPMPVAANDSAMILPFRPLRAVGA